MTIHINKMMQKPQQGIKRVLFLCVHNSARSQMAEALLRHIAGDRFDVASAGVEKITVHPEAILAMQQKGIDMKEHTSKTFHEFLNQSWDYVITVCDEANDACPAFPGGIKKLHWNFKDPSKVQGEKRQQAFDDAANKIEEKINDFVTT